MLAVSSYPQDQIDAARADVAAALAAFDVLPASPARDALEPVFCNNLLVALDARFTHRVRAKEGKDGNPLNEVRLLCEALVEHGAVFAEPPKSMKYKPEAAVLGLAPGDAVALSRDDVASISDAFFAELEARYGETAAA
jgi:hypothetical protein